MTDSFRNVNLFQYHVPSRMIWKQSIKCYISNIATLPSLKLSIKTSLILLDPLFSDRSQAFYHWVSPKRRWDLEDFARLIRSPSPDCLPSEKLIKEIKLPKKLCPADLVITIENSTLVMYGKVEGTQEVFMRNVHIPKTVEKSSVRCDFGENGKVQVYGQLVDKHPRNKPKEKVRWWKQGVLINHK